MFAADPVSVKAIVPSGGAVLLLQKADGTWELPGGRLEPHESIDACVKREVLEETGLTCAPRQLVSLVNLRRAGLPSVVVATLACAPVTADALRLSEEHVSHAFMTPAEVHGVDMLACYRGAIDLWVGGEANT